MRVKLKAEIKSSQIRQTIWETITFLYNTTQLYLSPQKHEMTEPRYFSLKEQSSFLMLNLENIWSNHSIKLDRLT